MTQKTGAELNPGDEIELLGHWRTIKRIHRTLISPKVLCSYYAERFPAGMPGGFLSFAHERDRVSSMTFFDSETYEVH
jgi:hypothetical protein